MAARAVGEKPFVATVVVVAARDVGAKPFVAAVAVVMAVLAQ